MQEPAFFQKYFYLRLCSLLQLVFCLGNVFKCSKENEKAKPSSNWVIISVGNRGISVTSCPSRQCFCHCSVWVMPGSDSLVWKMCAVLHVVPVAELYPRHHSLLCLTPLSSSALLHLQVATAFAAAEIPWNEVSGGILWYKQGSGEGGMEHRWAISQQPPSACH